ncbi:ANTAR domain-containing protein [Spongisporangium articulatum]|uniref:ANTAR domain-containing protein n=1 Tax=Spongisporangium articulatum TaxID=3362603 RepID=A0ABW8ANW2_9ACTN
MASARQAAEDVRRKPGPENTIRGEFSYDGDTRSWAWTALEKTAGGHGYAPRNPTTETGTPRLRTGELAERLAVVEAVEACLRDGLPFSVEESLLDEDGAPHQLVIVGLPDGTGASGRVRGVVLEQPGPGAGPADLPVPSHHLGPLPEGVTIDDLPWRVSHEWLPAGLMASVNLCLESSSPTALIWGEQRWMIYNQAYTDIIPALHPQLFGESLPAGWPEGWAVFGELIDHGFRTGESQTIVDKWVPIESGPYTLDRYFSYALTPVRADDGTVIGLFAPVFETTVEVLRRRRLATLAEIASQGVADLPVDELYQRLARALSGATDDVPFTLAYLIEPSDRSATLKFATGLSGAVPDAAPERIRLDATDGWPIAEAIATGQPLLVDDVQRRFPGLTAGPHGDRVERALVSFANLDHERLPNAVHILGVSNRLTPDAEYQSFLNKVARTIQADLTSAATAHLDRERSANLQRAMQSNRQIGAAIGILMTIHKVTEQQAFMLLSKASQQSNRKLRDIADDVVLAGTLPPESVTPAAKRPGGPRRRNRMSPDA